MLINSDGQVNNEKSVKHSTQREVIYETLKNTTSHPDVDAIYKEVKRRLPRGVSPAERRDEILWPQFFHRAHSIPKAQRRRIRPLRSRGS